MDRYEDPIARFQDDLARASAEETFDATRCALGTVNADGRPSVRYVLLKGADARGFVFFTNYESRKAHDLAANPKAALAFHWSSLGEQVRIEGTARKLDASASDAYFATRERTSRIGAWASPQSRPIASRSELEARVAETERRFEGSEVPRPPFWGGFVLVPDAIEFWFDGTARLHDRYSFTRTAEHAAWSFTRLAP